MNEENASPLWAWAEKVQSWQSDLLRRLSERAELTTEDTDEVLANVAAELDPAGPALPFGRRLEKDDLPSGACAAGSVRLSALTDIVRVGALRQDASLKFATTGITVVFGDNGAGKTTFARLLKQACRARVQDDNVHPNVFLDATSGAQTYTLEVVRDGNEERFARRVGDAPEPALGSISVFDAACADHYVAKGDEPAYVPRAVQLLEMLARAQKELRELVAEKRRALSAALPDFSGLPRPTATANAMAREDLDADTVQRLANVSEAELTRLAQLDRVLESTAQNEERLAAHQRELKGLTQLRGRLVDLAESASHDAVERWRAACAEADGLAKALAALGGRVEGLPLAPVGTQAWMALWRAAHAFFTDCAGSGAWGERCPLCQQTLADDARERFAAFTALASDQLERDHGKAAARVRAARELLERAKGDAGGVSRAIDGGELWRDAVRAFAERVEGRLAAALDGRDAGAEAESPLRELDRAMEHCKTQLAELVALQNRDELQNRRSERDELLARRQVAERRDEALRRVSLLAEIRALDGAHAALSTNALSRQQTKLTNQLVTDGLCQELERARDELGVRYLQVELAPGAKQGRAFVGLALPRKSKVKIEEVFSAGERRTLALAFFLAEVAAAEHDGTIVLDDPVSSLDADRRLFVARRLIEEARRRQVIVFTHDPHLLIMLRRECHGVPMTVLTCSNVNGTAGHVSEEEPWTTSRAATLAAKLRSRYLKDARKHHAEHNADAYGQAVDAFLKRLRKAWERAVAELFCGVVQPGSFEVQTKKLHDVVITDEMVAAVNEGMGTLSFDAHDQGAYMAQTLLRIVELEARVDALDRFLALVEHAQKRAKSSDAAVPAPTPN